MSQVNANNSIFDAKRVISKASAKWQARPTPPQKLKQDVQDALAPALDYLASHKVFLDTDQLAVCTAEELIQWIETSVRNLDLYENLQATLN
jgi:hypothetical protein